MKHEGNIMEQLTMRQLMENVKHILGEANFDYMTESKAVLANDDAFTSLVDALSEGLSYEEAQGFAVLAENSRNEFLMEANTSANLNAFAPMQMMLLRAIYPRLIARRAVENRTMQGPVEIFGWLKSFVRNGAGERVEATKITKNFIKGPSLAQTIDLTSGGVVDRDLFANATVAVNRSNYSKNVTVDRNSVLTKVKLEIDVIATGSEEVLTADVKFVPTIDGAFFGEQVFKFTGANDAVKVTLVGHVNRETGILNLSSMVSGLANTHVVTELKVDYDATVSYEDNHITMVVENEYVKDTIEANDGEIVQSTIPYSYLKDMQALMNMDAMAEAVNVLGGVFAQTTDLRVLSDLLEAVEGDVNRTLEWNAKMPQTHSITRIDHNLELVERIHRAISVCDDITQFNGNLQFNILTNPVDAAIVSSTNITSGMFSGKIATGGVVRNYTEGALPTTTGTATILSSKLVERGKVLIVPKSDSANEIVYGQFDYSQILLGHTQGYLNPDNPNVTNVAMLNRDARKAFRTEGITMIAITDSLGWGYQDGGTYKVTGP